MTFKKGDLCESLGRIVQEIILKSSHFIVFLDECGETQWMHNKVAVEDDDYNSVTNRIAKLEVQSRFLRSRCTLRKGEDVAERQHSLFAARRLIAEAMARLLDTGSGKAAHGMLDVAEQWIQQRSREYSRRWMLVPFSIVATVGLLVAFGLVKLAPLESHPHYSWLVGGLLGGLGALVSNVMFNRKIPFDAIAGKGLHYLEAFLRWMIGFAAGLIVQMLIQGNAVLGFIDHNDHCAAGPLVMSLLAGASELFFPTLLKRFDNGLESSEQQSPSGSGDQAAAARGTAVGSDAGSG